MAKHQYDVRDVCVKCGILRELGNLKGYDICDMAVEKMKANPSTPQSESLRAKLADILLERTRLYQHGKPQPKGAVEGAIDYELDKLETLFEAHSLQEQIEALGHARNDVDFAQRWGRSYDEILERMDGRIAVLEAERKKL